MNRMELERVVAEIRAILHAHGQPDRSRWLAERELVLASADSREAVTATLNELHSVVLGMGGLFDLPLTSSLFATAGEARKRLDELADQLYEMTRST